MTIGRSPVRGCKPSTQIVKSSPVGMGWQESLAGLIQDRVFPELAHALSDTGAGSPRRALPRDETEALVQSLLSSGPAGARRIASPLIAAGAQVEALLMDLIAPAARRLGNLWESDTCNFMQVALGLHDLRGLLADLPPPPPFPIQGRIGRILLLPAPGDQHTFGVEAAALIFRWNGWDAQVAAFREGARQAAEQPFDIVGFSQASEAALPEFQDGLADVRCASCNKSVQILAGGSLFDRYPALASSTGVDVAINSRWEILFWNRQPDSWVTARLRRLLQFSSAKPESEGDKQWDARGYCRTTKDDSWQRRRSEHTPAVLDP